MTNRTSIIILTHNQLHITYLCLESIRQYTAEPYEILVIDNGSTDETVNYLKSQADVKLICNEVNLGFAKGCNQGIEAATGNTLLFLNNDTIVTTGWLTTMLQVLHSNDNIGIVGPVTNYSSGQQQIAVEYVDLAGIQSFANAHATRYSGYSFEVRRLVGFCMLFKRQVIEEIGGFDELYGLGNYEDDDMCLRVLNQGYRLRVAYSSYIHHFGHMTTNILPDADLRGLLASNREKAKEKWGQDIHVLIYKEPTALTLVLPIDQSTDKELDVTLAQIQQIAEEIVVLDGGATSEILAKVTKLNSKIVRWSGETAGISETREQGWLRAAAEMTMPFLFWMKPGEHMTAEELRKISGLKLSLTEQIDAVSFVLKATSVEAEGGESSIIRRVRMVRRDTAYQWDADFQQFFLESEANVKQSDIHIS